MLKHVPNFCINRIFIMYTPDFIYPVFTLIFTFHLSSHLHLIYLSSISSFFKTFVPKKTSVSIFSHYKSFLNLTHFYLKLPNIHFLKNEISPIFKHSSWRSPYVWLGSTYQTYPCRPSEDMGVFRKFCAWCVSHTVISFGKYFLLANADILVFLDFSYDL